MTFRRFFGRPLAVLAATCAILAATAARADLRADGARLLRQGLNGFPDTSEEFDNLGWALAAGDFDGDGREDLAIDARGEMVFLGVDYAGQVTVLYGTDDGLDPASGELWALDWTAFGPGAPDDELGTALAAGDFDGDGYDDLAIGIPSRDVTAGGGAPVEDAGAVLVLYGGPEGLGLVGSQYWYQGANGLDGLLEAGDRFGASLASGNFNGDPFDDLAIGAPSEDVGAVFDSGAVLVIYGSPSGLSTNFAPVEDQVWVQTDLGLSIEEAGDYFGWSLAAGDFDGDGFDELAVGSPFEDIGPVGEAGAVSVLYGTGLGLSADGAQFFNQDDAVSPDVEHGDNFGYAVLAADLDGDGFDDLVAGSPGEDLDVGGVEVTTAGRVDVVRGAPGGLGSVIAWTLDRRDAVGTLANGDRFGDALTAGRFGGRPAHLVVGARGVEVAGQDYAGAAFVFAGRPAASPLFYLDLAQGGPVPGGPGVDDGFASALAAGDFDGDGFDELAVGVPFDFAGGAAEAGAVDLFEGDGLFTDGFETGNASRWSDAVSN